jgi:hypothetical protein
MAKGFFQVSHLNSKQYRRIGHKTSNINALVYHPVGLTDSQSVAPALVKWRAKLLQTEAVEE